MATTPTNLSGLFKEVYADNLINLIPAEDKLIRAVPFVPADKELGNKYHQPVIVNQEQGFTYAGIDAGAFALNSAISMNTQDAQVQGYQILLRSSLAYDAAARASNSRKAFVKETELMVENMMESITKRTEISCWYGQSGIATLASSVNGSATTTTVTITTAEFAAGIWAGMENGTIDVYQSDGTTKINSNALLTVTQVNVGARTLLLTGNSTDITNLDSYISSNPDAAIVFFRGANSNEMAGMYKIMTNTGTLFNISATTYNLWKSNTFSSSSAALTFGKLVQAVGTAVNRGLNEDVSVYVNPVTWGNLLTDQAALRRYDGSYSNRQVETGARSLQFHSQNGMIEVVSHNIVKEGQAFVFPTKRVRRIGAWDIGFKCPGRGDEEIFTQLADNAGYELRAYTDQSIFIETPAKCTIITGIVNSAS